MIDQNENEVEVGVYSLTYCGDRWTWDQRAEILSLNPEWSDGVGAGDFIFRLKSFTLFEANFKSLLTKKNLTLLEQALTRLLRGSPITLGGDLEQHALLHALGQLAFFVLCFALRQQSCQSRLTRLWKKRAQIKQLTDLRRTAEAVLEWLGPDGADTAWRDRYSRVLDYERRYRLLDIGRSTLEQGHGLKEAGESLLNLTEYDLLVARWWTTRCQFELASKWYQREGHRNPKARRALLDASGIYLQVLKDEPRRQGLEQFLDMIGTDPEREVEWIFQIRSVSDRKCLVAEDEAARRAFANWFLARYSIRGAYKLEKQSATKRQRRVVLISLVFGASAGLVFFFGGPTLLKILLQLISLILIVACAPSLFRLMLPRALFGSLIAWLTIVLAQSFEVFPLHQIQKADNIAHQAAVGQVSGLYEETRAVCHRWLTEPFNGWGGWIIDLHRFVAGRPVILSGLTIRGQGVTFLLPSFLVSQDAWSQRILFFAVVIGVLLVSLVFILNEVNRRILRRATLRSLGSLTIMVLGSLFWGITFANPIRILMEGGLRSGSCNCIWGIWLLGSVVSVLFGILVQVLTEERPLAVPSEEGV